jgi:hypothetical protein
MKFKRFYLLSLIALLFMASCEDEASNVEILSTAPVITLTSGTSIVAGASTPITIELKDGTVTPLASATVQIFRGEEEVFSSTQSVSGQAATITVPGSDVAALNVGVHTLKVTATDTGNNSRVLEVSITVVCNPLPSCVQSGLITVLLIAPVNTPSTSTVGLVGAINGWGGQPDITMTKIVDGCYCAAVSANLATANEFKFRLDSSWDKEELNASCQSTNNRVYSGGATTNQTVSRWKGVNPC